MTQHAKVPSLYIEGLQSTAYTQARIATASGRYEKDTETGEAIPLHVQIAKDIMDHFRRKHSTSKLCIALSSDSTEVEGKHLFELCAWILTGNQRRLFNFSGVYNHVARQFSIKCEDRDLLLSICKHIEETTSVGQREIDHDDLTFTVWRYF